MGYQARAKKSPDHSQKLNKSNGSKLGNCPDFDLAPLVDFPPAVLGQQGHEDVDAFVLALCLAFNDMKGVQWQIVQLEKCEPVDDAITPERGQWHGMRLQTSRMTLLVLHETLEAITAADSAGVFSDPLFAEALAQLSPVYQKEWKGLRELAQNAPGDSAVRKYITKVRHNFSAHYYQPKALLAGYKGFFFDRPADKFNAAAYASFGGKIEASRFYFADAAVQMGQAMLDPSEVLAAQVYSYVLTMFNALRFLIESYLQLRRKKLAGSQ